jgi:ribosomal protein L40E
MVLVGQDAEGRTVTQILWTISTIGKPESTAEPVPGAMLFLAIVGIVAVSAIFVWARRHAGRVSQAKPTSTFCIQCGAENPSTYLYCGKCGTKLEAK